MGRQNKSLALKILKTSIQLSLILHKGGSREEVTISAVTDEEHRTPRHQTQEVETLQRSKEGRKKGRKEGRKRRNNPP